MDAGYCLYIHNFIHILSHLNCLILTILISYEQRLAKTKLWSLEDRRTRADLIEVYKKFTVYQLSGSAQLSHNERTRGHSLKLHKKRVMTDLRQHFFRTGLSTSGTH